MKNTNCEKCIFSDYADSPDPCAMDIIDQIKDSKNLTINSENFYSVHNYLCPYAFSMRVYEEHKEELGSIDDLKKSLYLKNRISYYLIIFLEDIDPNDVVKSIMGLPIKPGFVSIVTYQKNNTENLINCFKALKDHNIEWKLHNMLERFDYQESISVVLDTNTAKNMQQFIWVNLATSYNLWNEDIINLNHIVTIKQPVAHALYRNQEDTDGLFITIKTYEEIRHSVNMDITLALKEIDNPLVKYYA